MDSATYSETYHKPINASLNWRSFGTHKVLPFTGGNTYTIKVQFSTENATGTAYIKRVAITALEVSNYYNAEQNTEITTTSTTYVTAGTATLTFQPPSQADYLILVTANLTTDTDTDAAFAQWTLDGTPDGTDHEIQQSGLTYMSWGAHELENLTAVSHTFTIQYHTTAATAKIKSARITAVLLTDLGDKQSAESEAESKTQLATYVDKTILSFTPSVPGDYILLISGLGKQESANYAFYANFDHDGTSCGEYVFVPGSDRIYRSFMWICRENLTAAPHTIKIQYRTSSSSPAREAFIKDANAMAIRINSAESYREAGHTNVWGTSSGEAYNNSNQTAYIWGHGYTSGTYSVEYYDVDSTLVATDSGISIGSDGVLSSSYLLSTDTNAVGNGFWTAKVLDAGSSVIAQDTFYVAQNAIPEFPTVIAGIGVAGFCFGIYWWMRRRKLAYVKA